MEIKPIETIYNGYRFRSRLEARWAVFFDELGVQYEYEPEGFEMPSGNRYLPDFKIKCYGTRGGNCSPDAMYPCLHCMHNLDYDTGFYIFGDGASYHSVRNHCEVFEPVRDKNNPMFPNMDVNGKITVYDCNRKEYHEPFDLYVEVKGRMTRSDAERIREFCDGSGDGKMLPVLVVGDIPNPEEYEAQSDNLKSYDRMDGVDIYPWNYETIDGDHFAAYPAVDSQGHFYLDGDDSNYQTMDINIIRNAFRAARQARFEHGETPRR